MASPMAWIYSLVIRVYLQPFKARGYFVSPVATDDETVIKYIWRQGAEVNYLNQLGMCEE